MFKFSFSSVTGSFIGTFHNQRQILEMINFIGSGIQVSHSWSCCIDDKVTGATVSAAGRSARCLPEIVQQMLDTLSHIQPPLVREGAMQDVTVPVHFALEGHCTMTDAEDFVRGAVERAIAENASRPDTDFDVAYNGEIVLQGTATRAFG
jgi:hypothetical protein